jgi:hypothetical protein
MSAVWFVVGFVLGVGLVVVLSACMLSSSISQRREAGREDAGDC